MGNVKEVVKSWRRRQYFYASASVFTLVGEPLKLWLKPLVNGVLDEDERRRRVKSLFRVNDHGAMYKLVGNALVNFIEKKHAPFPGALGSQQNFLSVSAWKRALLYINLVRHVTGLHANNHWFKYGYRPYKENKRMMENYCAHDAEIVKRSTRFEALPEKPVTTPVKVRKKRTRDQFQLSSPEAVGVPSRKIICVISSDSDTESEESEREESGEESEREESEREESGSDK